MELGLYQGLGLRQEQKLTPQLLQGLKVLQATTQELEILIKDELETNPCLEINEEGDQEWERQEDPSPEDRINQDDEFGELDDPRKSEVDWDEYFRDDFDRSGAKTNDYEMPEETLERQPIYAKELSDHLDEQLSHLRLDEVTHSVVEYLIDSLDEDGLLRQSSEVPPPDLDDALHAEIEAVIAQTLDVFEASAPVRNAFHILWNFEPCGIGGRSLQECLLLQFRRRGGSDLARRILEEGFAMLVKVQISALAKAFDSPPEAIHAAIREIGTLDPKPGKGLAPDSSPPVTPDLLVTDDGEGGLRIQLNDKHMPELRVSRAYKEIYESSSTSKNDKNFLRKKLDGANWFIRNIESRRSTMLKTMGAIVELQRPFFEEGPSALRPMILQDVADRIEMHISTVNRVTNGKYVQTPFGVYELKAFFTASVAQEDGSEASAGQIREAIQNMVANEDPAKPLSDQALADGLEKAGLNVARRTVAKYREQLEILPARMRKKF